MSYFDAYFTFANRSGMRRTDFPNETLNRQQFYVRLVDFLAPAYPALAAEQLATIAGVGYLYFQFYLSVDTVLDEAQLSPEAKRSLLKRLAYFEEAVTDLGRTFPADSPFWRQFAACKRQFYGAGAREQAISRSRERFSDTLFEEIAEGKSALCYATVHALDVLDHRSAPSQDLLECIRAIHLAFQYRDDLGDFARDQQSGQWTQVQDWVRDYLTQHGLEDEVGPEEWHNVVYTGGIAHRVIGAAIGHYEAALVLAGERQLDALADFLRREIRDCRGQLFEIDLLLRKTEALAGLSDRPRLGATAPLSEEETERALSCATRFLLDQLTGRPAGWADFMTTAGEGTGWITGYVAMHLTEAGVASASLDELLHQLQRAPERATYNDSIQRDGDSCTFVFGALSAAGHSADPGFRRQWLTFQDPDGGWVTYRDGGTLAARLELDPVPDLLPAVAGWLSPKSCVTAAAAYVLSGRTGGMTAALEGSLNYLRARQRPDGSLPAYWWTSDVYATAYALLAASRAGVEPTDPFVAGMRTYLHGGQHDLGYWDNGMGEACPFYTALAVRSLLASGTPASERGPRLACRWLLREQREDGSWIATRKLRIPAPDVEHPESVGRWRRSSFGTNIVVDDHHRSFTTATVLAALVAHAAAVDRARALSTLAL